MINRLRGSAFIWFVPFLFIIVGLEYMGLYYKYVLVKSNAWIHNAIDILSFPFWTLLFASQFSTIKHKRISWIATFIFLVVAFRNIWINGIHRFSNYVFNTGATIVIILSCIYFLWIMKNEQEEDLIVLPMFWFTSGALLFFTGSFFYFSLYSYMRSVRMETSPDIFNLIIYTLIGILYSCISVGIILTRRRKT